MTVSLTIHKAKKKSAAMSHFVWRLRFCIQREGDWLRAPNPQRAFVSGSGNFQLPIVGRQNQDGGLPVGELPFLLDSRSRGRSRVERDYAT